MFRDGRVRSSGPSGPLNEAPADARGAELKPRPPACQDTLSATSHLSIRDVIARSPLSVMGPVQSRRRNGTINIKKVFASPARRIGRILHGPHSPVRCKTCLPAHYQPSSSSAQKMQPPPMAPNRSPGLPQHPLQPQHLQQQQKDDLHLPPLAHLPPEEREPATRIIWSTGMADNSERKTWAQVTTPGERFKQTNSAFGPRLLEAG